MRKFLKEDFKADFNKLISIAWQDPTEKSIVKILFANKKNIEGNEEKGKEFLQQFNKKNKSLLQSNCSQRFIELFDLLIATTTDNNMDMNMGDDNLDAGLDDNLSEPTEGDTADKNIDSDKPNSDKQNKDLPNVDIAEGIINRSVKKIIIKERKHIPNKKRFVVTQQQKQKTPNKMYKYFEVNFLNEVAYVAVPTFAVNSISEHKDVLKFALESKQITTSKGVDYVVEISEQKFDECTPKLEGTYGKIAKANPQDASIKSAANKFDSIKQEKGAQQTAAKKLEENFLHIFEADETKGKVIDMGGEGTKHMTRTDENLEDDSDEDKNEWDNFEDDSELNEWDDSFRDEQDKAPRFSDNGLDDYSDAEYEDGGTEYDGAGFSGEENYDDLIEPMENDSDQYDPFIDESSAAFDKATGKSHFAEADDSNNEIKVGSEVTDGCGKRGKVFDIDGRNAFVEVTYNNGEVEPFDSIYRLDELELIDNNLEEASAAWDKATGKSHFAEDADIEPIMEEEGDCEENETGKTWIGYGDPGADNDMSEAQDYNSSRSNKATTNSPNDKFSMKENFIVQPKVRAWKNESVCPKCSFGQTYPIAGGYSECPQCHNHWKTINENDTGDMAVPSQPAFGNDLKVANINPYGEDADSEYIEDDKVLQEKFAKFVFENCEVPKQFIKKGKINLQGFFESKSYGYLKIVEDEFKKSFQKQDLEEGVEINDLRFGKNKMLISINESGKNKNIVASKEDFENFCAVNDANWNDFQDEKYLKESNERINFHNFEKYWKSLSMIGQHTIINGFLKSLNK